jgi:Tol biopolymer transport system component
MKLKITCLIILPLFLSAPITWADGITTRLTVNSNGIESNSDAFTSAVGISADGRYVVFTSDATNLVPDDTNNAFDVFVEDRWLKQITRVSVNNDGKPGDLNSSQPAISADGRYIALSSYATNLVPNDTNNVADIFVYDQQTHQITCVSIDSQGSPSNGNSFNPTPSSNGHLIAFESEATNLVPDDTNNASDIFLYDIDTKQIQRVSVNSQGQPSNGNSFAPAISGDGRYIAFESLANLSADDTTPFSKIFVHDHLTQQTYLVSVATSGNVNGHSFAPSISADGHYVAFESQATNLVPTDINAASDIFIRDLQTNQTTLVSLNLNKEQGNADSLFPTLSGDGRYVLFNSTTTNLVANDTNGVFDTFQVDRNTGQIFRVNVNSTGKESDYGPFAMPVALTQDGCVAAFTASATNLVTNDTNGNFDIFAHTNLTQRPTYDFATGILNLPTVQVKDYGIFSATLHLIPDSNFKFRVDQATALSGTAPNTSCASFSFDTGLLYLPVVQVLDPNGKNLVYEVVMNIVPLADPIQLGVAKATSF